jgi:hypothetical protein
MKTANVARARIGFGSLKMGLSVAAAASLSLASFNAWAGPDSAQTGLHSPWISCSDVDHVAYRVVPPALNPHNMFTHPIKVQLKSGQSCADLK